MAGKTTSVLKTYFAKYAKPTAAQFAEFIDTLYEKAASVLPQDTNSFNLGSLTKQWKDIYSSGEAFLSKITATGLSTLSAVKATVFYNASCSVIDASVAINIDLSSNNIFAVTVDSDTAITFTNPKAGIYKLILNQDAVGGHNVTMADIFKTGAFGTAASNVDIVNITCDGGKVYGEIVNNFRA